MEPEIEPTGAADTKRAVKVFLVPRRARPGPAQAGLAPRS